MSSAKENIFFYICKIQFDKKNAPMVSIVPNIWVQNCSNMYFCFWPPQTKNAPKMIKLAVLPDEETWFQYPCEIFKTFGTYEEARSKLPKYDIIDDPESSNIENRGRGKRKKKPNTWKMNSDSESDGHSPSMITMPEPPNWIKSVDDSYRTNKLKPINNTTPVSQKKIKEYTNFYPDNYSTQNSKSTASLTTPVLNKVKSIFTTPVPQNYVNDNNPNNLTQINLLVQDQFQTDTNSDNCLSPPMFESNNECHNEDNEQYQPSSSGAVDLSHTTIHLLQQQILLVQQIVQGQQVTNKLLTKLIMSNGESKPQSTIRQKCFEHFILPAKSVAEVCDIEEKLQLSASRQLMISRLQQCGGRSQNDTTTLVLRTLLTDYCASNYNFEGRNSGKHAFKDLIMCSIVIDVTMMKHPTGSEDMVRCRIKNWLRLAPTREKYKKNKE